MKCGWVQTELVEEKEKAKEEAEDLAQEMAELRFQLMEMLDHERELRSRTEQASVHRVEELEAQVNRSCRCRWCSKLTVSMDFTSCASLFRALLINCACTWFAVEKVPSGNCRCPCQTKRIRSPP